MFDPNQPYEPPKAIFKAPDAKEDPAKPAGRKPKRVIVAVLLAFFLGMFGAHNFYLKRQARAIGQLAITLLSLGVLFVVSWIWAMVEMFLILTAKPGSKWAEDGEGYPLLYD